MKVMLIWLFCLQSIFLTTSTLAGEGGEPMGIILTAIGRVDIEILEKLRNKLEIIFKKEVIIGRGMPEPIYALNEKRNQYLSTAIVRSMMKQKEYAQYEKVLGVVDYDLYVPELNFVFGEAGRKAAVISLTRLRQGFYGLPEDKNLFHKRILTEAVHELGHTYGLIHCTNPRCVMFFSNSLVDTDRKGFEFCERCSKQII